MDPAAPLDMPERPWSAEIKDPLNDKHPKYNLPLASKAGDERSQMLATALTSATSLSPLARSPSTKMAKEQWVANVAKGVDYVRESASATVLEATTQKEPTELLQVKNTYARARTHTRTPANRACACARSARC